MTTPFRSGINYWPRSTAMEMWKRFDRGEIDEDLARIRELGLDIVRFFLLWEDFAPDRVSIDSTALGNLSWMLERLGDHGLLAMPTLFTGHMSGVNWLPLWTLDPLRLSGRFRTISQGVVQPFGIGDFYTGELLQAQQLLVREVGTCGRGCEAILAWDLGNEFSNLREPASAADAGYWSGLLTGELVYRSGRPVTGGTHGEDLTLDRKLRLSSLSLPWKFATMHGYSVYSEFARDRRDIEVVPFLARLATTFSGRPVLFSEYGNPSRPPGAPEFAGMASLDEEEMCEYARGVFDGLHRAGALGAMWWCWADYVEEFAVKPPFDKAPHELHFGIIRADGSEKPIARTLASLAAEKREVLPPQRLELVESRYYPRLPGATAAAYARYLEGELAADPLPAAP